MSGISAVILAGGPMHRATGVARALLPVHETPLIGYVLDVVERLSPESVTIVGGEGWSAIQDWVGDRARVIEQRELYGSGHAVGLALEHLGKSAGELLVTYADRIFLRENTLRSLLDARHAGAAAGVLSVFLDRQAGYARIVRDAAGKVLRGTGDCELVRAEDASIREVVAGAYWFEIQALRKALLPPATLERKYNLTECLQPIVDNGGLVIATPLSDPLEASGVYSLEAARLAEARIPRPSFAARIRHKSENKALCDTALSGADSGRPSRH